MVAKTHTRWLHVLAARLNIQTPSVIQALDRTGRILRYVTGRLYCSDVRGSHDSWDQPPRRSFRVRGPLRTELPSQKGLLLTEPRRKSDYHLDRQRAEVEIDPAYRINSVSEIEYRSNAGACVPSVTKSGGDGTLSLEKHESIPRVQFQWRQ